MNTFRIVLYTLIILILIAIILRTLSSKTIESINTNLLSDGFDTQNILSKDNINIIQNLWDNKEYKQIHQIIQNDTTLDSFIHSHLSNDYILMDYIMFLENSVLHTCHRDNNSKRFNDDIHESFTIIIYIDEMDKCLDLIPGSHDRSDSGIYLYDKTKTWSCKSGDAILFNADLVHSGSLQSKYPNRRIQLKCTHKKDIEQLNFFSNYHKLLNKKNTNGHLSKVFQKHLSCQFPIVSDLTQGTNKNYINGELTDSDKLVSNILYSKPDYYSLEDAF
jgi:hypothetical protein